MSASKISPVFWSKVTVVSAIVPPGPTLPSCSQQLFWATQAARSVPLQWVGSLAANSEQSPLRKITRFSFFAPAVWSNPRAVAVVSPPSTNWKLVQTALSPGCLAWFQEGMLARTSAMAGSFDPPHPAIDLKNDVFTLNVTCGFLQKSGFPVPGVAVVLRTNASAGDATRSVHRAARPRRRLTG